MGVDRIKRNLKLDTDDVVTLRFSPKTAISADRARTGTVKSIISELQLMPAVIRLLRRIVCNNRT